jgi:hypothetical protein
VTRALKNFWMSLFPAHKNLDRSIEGTKVTDDLNQPDLTDHPTVENVPHAVEDMGISNEGKIDALLQTAVTVRQELLESRVEAGLGRRRIVRGILAACLFFALVLGAAGGALWGIHQQAVELQEIARDNRANGQTINETLQILTSATNDEATARARAATADAINEIRRSIDCTKLSDEATYPACVETVARLDAIRAGLDPFAR